MVPLVDAGKANSLGTRDSDPRAGPIGQSLFPSSSLPQHQHQQHQHQYVSAAMPTFIPSPAQCYQPGVPLPMYQQMGGPHPSG